MIDTYLDGVPIWVSLVLSVGLSDSRFLPSEMAVEPVPVATAAAVLVRNTVVECAAPVSF